MDYDALDAQLGGRLERNVPLAPFTTFRIGGPADRLFRARTAAALVEAIGASRAAGVPWFVLGRGANILVGDLGYRGLVIRSEVAGITFLEGDRVRAGAGVETFHDLIEATVSRGLGGLHHYVGIPSTVGGALWQNLHFLSPAPERARTCFIAEVLESAEVLLADGGLQTVGADWFRFGYDYSTLHDAPHVVLSATFRLQAEPVPELRRVIHENLEWRAGRHPDLWLYPCAGSIFRKIDDVGAGRLIDECGLKGKVLGNARIYPRHANIIVNLGGASAAEVRALMELARETVERELGLALEPEIQLIGEF
ncbi:MAG: UDP-N-acetylmuramate dehydrogenase [Gemmatimonadota bacterium]|jgi:UDP-N-acetylmuramate dehydrogenase